MKKQIGQILDKNFNCEPRHRDIVVGQILALFQPQPAQEGGLKIWICKHTPRFAGSMEVLTSESVTFPKGDDGCCDDDGFCEVDYGYCDAKSYIVQEAKP